ncbi:MAG: hypothetical protein KatS3mg038_2345 [Candidatus Kapaibacterium sp.]|nr:MAG: hypothetical protein KatS3mg038_2345 [Candidatus Kapabacteria bacterium]
MIPSASYPRPPYYYVPVPTIIVGDGAATAPQVYVRETAVLSHTIAHNLGRLPIVEVYNLAGDRIVTDVTATDTTLTVSGNTAFACIIIVW